MRLSETLEKAKDVLKTGRCLYTLAVNEVGDGVPPTSPEACQWCAY